MQDGQLLLGLLARQPVPLGHDLRRHSRGRHRPRSQAEVLEEEGRRQHVLLHGTPDIIVG